MTEEPRRCQSRPQKPGNKES